MQECNNNNVNSNTSMHGCHDFEQQQRQQGNQMDESLMSATMDVSEDSADANDGYHAAYDIRSAMGQKQMAYAVSAFQQQQQLNQTQLNLPFDAIMSRHVTVATMSKADRSSELHELCCKDNKRIEEVAKALNRDPNAASRQAKVATDIKLYNHSSGKIELKRTVKSYKYPLNLAIRHKASLDVIKMLMNAAPEVTRLPDGCEQETSLHIMLKHRPAFTAGIDALMLHDPQPASPLDRRSNTVLHTACQYGAPLVVVRRLIILYPDALFRRNFHNELPIQVAQRNLVMCATEVATFVRQETNKGLQQWQM